jgi:hypothetical protein
LIPPPVEPALVAKRHRNSISVGAKIGHTAKSALAKPVVVAIDTTLNSENRNAERNDGYV